MKYLLFFLLIGLSSCYVITGHHAHRSPYTYTYTCTTPIRTYTPSFNGAWWFTPRPNYLGNVYNNYYIIPRTTIRTNLPLQNGPRGGRRK